MGEGIKANRSSAIKLRPKTKQDQQPDKANVLDDHVIDFIFYSKKHWVTKAYLDFPSFGEINRSSGGTDWEGHYIREKHAHLLGELLPNLRYPSDHAMRGAVLMLQPCDET